MAERSSYPRGDDPGAHAGGSGAGHDPARAQKIEAEAAFDLADAIDPRYRVLVLLLAFVPGVSRERIRACRRRHIDLPRSRMLTGVPSEEAGGEHAGGGHVAPESGSDRWTALPPFLVEELSRHLDGYSQPGPDGYVFTDPAGGPLDLAQWHKSLRRAREVVGLTDIRPHDLHPGREHDRRPTGGGRT